MAGHDAGPSRASRCAPLAKGASLVGLDHTAFVLAQVSGADGVRVGLRLSGMLLIRAGLPLR